MDLSRENLKDFNLFYLRSLARELGVKSPTTLSKSELIDRIIDVSSGNTTPAEITRGRPPLKVFEIEKKEVVDKKTVACLKKIQRTCNLLNEEIQTFLYGLENKN